MLKLRRLRVVRFRSLARDAELSFSDGINVLLGQNGTGKTTLLELISMVVRSDFSTLAKEEFAIEYELSVPEGESIIVVIRNDRVAIEQPQRPTELGQRDAFRHSVEVLRSTDRHRLVRFDAERGLSIGDAPPKVAPELVFSPLEQGFLVFLVAEVVAGVKAFSRYLVQAGNAHRLDESLDVFWTVTVGDRDGNFLIYGDEWHANPSAPQLVPDIIIQKLRASHEPKKPDYSFTDGDLDLLATLKDMMGFSASELRVVVTERRDPPRVQIGNLVFRFWWEDGTFITHDGLSYGQKRLVSFFYYLACNPDIVIADELVNGLHHRWITASIDAIGPRQAFLTSQNPLLLDYVPMTSAEEARRSFVLCRAEPQPGERPRWIWENMSEEDAAELFSAYGVGVEHVSEILQSRGLW
jgi:energy-coupling factor transporter ATP-binding protein EcfA2